LLLSGCGNVYSREDFTAAVVGKSEQEVQQQFGKPDAVQSSSADKATWVYTHKTFDLTHQNKVDAKTTVTLERLNDADKSSATRVEFTE
jgi:outer membrane protein assembly factor BamE (lipoprotein component of BamABCDE complex)